MLNQFTARSFGKVLEDPWFCVRLFDRMNDTVFYIKDCDAKYMVVNDTMVARCGYASKGELVGKTAADVFPPEFGEGYLSQDQEVLTKGSEIRGLLEKHTYENGRSGWCLTDKTPLYDTAGNIIGLTGVSRDVQSSADNSVELKKVAEAISEIQTRYPQPLRISELATKVGLTISRLERLVSKIYGMNPSQLLIKTRVEAASRQLIENDKCITEIAHACGYTDHSAFTRQFRMVVGMTPSQYRNANASPAPARILAS